MFDIGFSEILLIALVTLLVMGPERLPQTVRSISLWIGRLKQMLAKARQDLEQEVGMDDIRQQLHNEQIMRELNESKEHLEESYNQTFNKDLGEDFDRALENPFAKPLADEEPSASEEPLADKEPLASEEPLADKEPLANEEPSASLNKEQEPLASSNKEQEPKPND